MIDSSIIDFCKQLELYIASDYYRGQIIGGCFSTRFDKFLLENDRAKDVLFMIDVLKSEANEKHSCLDLLEDVDRHFKWVKDNEPENFNGSDGDLVNSIQDCLKENGRPTEKY